MKSNTGELTASSMNQKVFCLAGNGRLSTDMVCFILSLFLLCCNLGACMAQEEHDPYAAARRHMLEYDLKGRDILNPSVLKAMEKVPRHLFVDNSQQHLAYGDHPLPIGEGQTISQPYIVALMTQSLNVKKSDKVLEVGTGSGYQAAVLAQLASQVYSIEINERLAKQAKQLLESLGYRNITTAVGDGYRGWKEYAPFDAIMVTCAPSHIPEPLIKQLKPGGKIIIPLGESIFSQELILGIKHGNELKITHITGVRFVPMVGEAQKKTN